MPYTATSPTIVLCDALVAFIEAQWQPNAPNSVKRAHRGQNSRADTSKGRQVRVIPMGYEATPAARGLDFYQHRIGVVTFERYEASADADEVIPIEWIDERVDWVHDQIFNGLDFYRDGTQPTFNRFLQTMANPVEDIYDPDRLHEKIFWSEIEFVFEELETV